MTYHKEEDIQFVIYVHYIYICITMSMKINAILNAILNKSDTDFGKYILLMTMYSIWTKNKTVVFCIEPIYQSIVLHNI